jgi:hypothetical protein
MPDKNKQGRIFLLDRTKAAQTGTIWLSLFQEEKLVRDLVGGQDLSNPGGFTINEGGSVATFNGAQQKNKAIVFPSGFGIGNIIVAARIKATGTQASNPGAAFGIYASSGNQTGIGVGFDTSNNVGHSYLDSFGAGVSARSAGAQNVYYTVFAQRMSDTRMYAWINGKPATTSQGGNDSGSIATVNEICIGAQHRSSGFLRQFKGNIEWAALIYLPLGQNNPMPDAYAEALYNSNYPYSLEAKPNRIWVASAGGYVSLSITGQSLTANLGALSASVTSSVTGNQTTLQQGTITANVSQTLTGQAISLVQGSVSSDVSTVITGQTVSLAHGSVTDASSGNVTKALSGQSLSVSQGALTASISLALNGQSIVLSGGSVSPAISSALAGQQASVQQGNVSANISAGLTGQAAVISNGTVFQAGSDVTKALTGQQLSIALGVLLEKKTIARPSSDTTAGAWLPSAGSSLYATLDEVSPDDADYIYTNSVSTCKIALNAVADPLTSSGQIVSYRVWSPNSNGLTVRLMQGATEIASWTHTVLPTSPTTYQQTLTAGQCDAITDYSTLAIQLESV